MKKTMKNAISSLTAKLAALLLAFTCAGTAWGALSGSGTEADPYLIGNKDDMVEFGSNFLSYTPNPANYFKVVNDIDLEGVSWTPISLGQDDASVHKTYYIYADSQKVLSNLSVTAQYAGLFGYLTDAGRIFTVKNLTIDHATIVASKGTERYSAAGAFFAYSESTITMENCHVTNSSISSDKYTGGLIGYSTDNDDGQVLTLKNCSVSGTTFTTSNGASCAGGLLGMRGARDVVVTGCAVDDLQFNNDSSYDTGALIGRIGSGGMGSVGGCEATDVKVSVAGADATAVTDLVKGLYAGATVTEIDPLADPSWTKVADGFYQNAASTDFYITSKEGLEYFRDLVNQVGTVADTYVTTYVNASWTAASWYTGNIFTGKTVHLMTDVDLENVEWSPIGQPANPAGDKRRFYGHFNGENHTISNLKATTYVETIKTWYPGLFGALGPVSGQTISNLTINNVTLIGYDYAGAIVGNAGSNPTAFNNCHVTGNIDIKCTMTGAFVGGIVGIGTCAIDDCSVEGGTGSTIQGSTVGGLAGTSTRTANENANTVTDSTVTGVTVKSDDNGGQAGGLVGKATNPVTVTGNTVHDITVSAEAGKADALVGGVGGDVTASSNTTDTNVTVVSDPITGSGTAEDPYIIPNLDTLKVFRDRVNGGTTYQNKFVKMADNLDIDLASEGSWTPIGNKVNVFKGTFDGNDVIFRNLTINDSALNYAGLFGFMAPGTLKNINIVNVNISANNCIGAIAGGTQGSTYIDNCTVTGTINLSGNHYIGGISGWSYANTTDCLVDGGNAATSFIHGADLTANSGDGDDIGGIIGFAGEAHNKISGCTVKNVTIEGFRQVGGIAGIARVGKTIENCTVENVVVKCIADEYTTQNKASKMAFGGIVGVVDPSTGANDAVTISGCEVSGVSLESTETGKAVARMGYVSGGRYNTAEFTITEDDNVSISNTTVENCTRVEGTLSPVNDPGYIDGPYAARIGNVKYDTLAAALADVTKDAPLTWVSEDAWPVATPVYYNGNFYAVAGTTQNGGGALDHAIAQANTDHASSTDVALIYVRPGYTQTAGNEGAGTFLATYNKHQPFASNIIIYGNNASLGGEAWEPSVTGMTRDMSVAIYNLHDGAGIWGQHNTPYVLTATMENCNNVHEYMVNGSEGSAESIANVTIKNCTFGTRNNVVVASTNPGTVVIDGCTFTENNNNYVVNINNKNGGTTTATISNSTFNGGGNGSKGVVRINGEVEGTTMSGTFENLTFNDTSSAVADIQIGHATEAADNKANVSYTVSGTTGVLKVFETGSTTLKNDGETSIVAANNYTGDNTPPHYVAQVGSTKYENIADAVAAWGPGKTLTLLDNVTYDQTVIVEVNATKSTQNWTLDLGDYTWTADGCNAFQLYAAGGTAINQNYGLKVYANENGGITAAGKYCIECKYDTSTAGYRPRLEIHGGTYTGSYIIYYASLMWNNTSVSNGPSTWFYKGNDGKDPVFNGNFALAKCPVNIYAGVFNGTTFNTYPVSSTANTGVNAGKFKALPSNSNNKATTYASGRVFVADTEGYYDFVSTVPETYTAYTSKLSGNPMSPYTGGIYWESADDAIAKISSLTVKTVTLSAGVTATQPLSISSGTYTIDATAEGAAYDGQVTLKGTSAKFVLEGEGGAVVTDRSGYVVTQEISDDTYTYSIFSQSQAAAKIGDYYYKTLDAAVANYQDGNTIYVLNYQEDVTVAPEGWTFKAAGDDMTLVKAVAKIGTKGYLTVADALAAVQDGETITVLDATGNESGTELTFDRQGDIAFTITGTAPNYRLPIITFADKDGSGGKITVTIKDATLAMDEIDARQNATVNVVDSFIDGKGGNTIVKSYFNGAINISGTSKVYTMQVTTMGYITISDSATLTATWQANVYGNGLISVNPGATFNTAALNLTGQAYSGRDNTDADRVGKPAAVIVDGATLNVGVNAYSSSGADYNYNSTGYGINVGTVDGKSAILDIKNDSTVVLAQGSGSGEFGGKVSFGAGATVNVTGGSSLTVQDRGTAGVTLTNQGTVALDAGSSVTAPEFVSEDGKVTVDMANFDGTLPLTVVTTTGGEAVLGDFEVYNMSDTKIVVDTNGDLSVVAKVYVAQLGNDGQKFETLAEAVEAAQDGETVTVLANTTLDEQAVVSGKAITLDLAGKTVTATVDDAILVEDDAELTVKGEGTVIAGVATAFVNEGTLVIESGTVKGSAGNGAILVANDGGTLDVNGGTFELKVASGTGGWAIANDGGVATITDATIVSEATSQAVGVWTGHPDSVTTIDGNTQISVKGADSVAVFTWTGGETTILDGVVSAEGDEAAAIQNDSTGTTTVSGGTITAGESCAAVLNTGSGSVEISGDAEVAATGSNSYAAYALSSGEIDITGGTITGTVDETLNDTVMISGGSFSNPVREDFCADGFEPVAEPNANDMYTVQVEEGKVARNVEKNKAYASLADAFAEAAAGETVQLLADQAGLGTVAIPANVTLDGNGLTLSGDVAITLASAGGAVKNIDFSDVKPSRGTIESVISATPAAGAVFTITGNTFTTPGAVKQILIEAADATDFTAKISGNAFNAGSKTKRAFAVVNAADAAKLTLDGNFIADGLFFGASADGANVSEKAYPQFAAADAATAEKGVPAFVVKKDATDGKPAIFGYATLSAAVEGATSGDMVLMNEDATLDASVATAKNVTVDGQDNTLTITDATTVKGVSSTDNGVTTTGNVTFQNITVKYADGAYASAPLGANVTLGENVVIDASAVTAAGVKLATGIAVAAGATPEVKVGSAVAAGDTLISALTLGDGASVSVSGLPTGLFDAIADNALALRTQEAKVTVGETVTYYNTLQEALNAAATARTDATVDVLCDIDMTGKPWAAVYLDGYSGQARNVTINGNDKKITGLGGALVSGVWSNAGVTFKDLTLVGSKVESTGSYAGAFILSTDSCYSITLDNCHVEGATISSSNYAGGLIGYSSMGSGKVLTITNCSVKDSTISGNGSAGGVIGHALGGGNTTAAITGTTVTGNAISGEKAAKTGAVMGTVGAGTCELAATVDGNTLKTVSGDTLVADQILGRAAGGELDVTGGNYSGLATYADGTHGDSNGGKVVISGGTFQTQPSQDAIADGFVAELSQDVNGWWTVGGPFVAKIGNVGYATLAEAVAAAQDGDTVELLVDVEIKDTTTDQNAGTIAVNKSITIDGGNHTVKIIDDGKGKGHAFSLTVKDQNTGAYASGDLTITIKDLVVDGNNVAKHGINVYGEAGHAITVTLDNVETKNNRCFGLNVNSAVVNANDLKASGNGWGKSVGIDPKYQNASLTISGENTNLADTYSVDMDNSSSGGANAASVAISEGTYTQLLQSSPDNTTFAVSGGTFTSVVPDDFCADGFIPAEQDPDTGLYTVKTGTFYDVWVGGTRITSANAADVFGDGKVSYDPATATLTLNGYTYSGAGHEGSAVYTAGDIAVVVAGENALASTAGDAIHACGNITVTGSGTDASLAVTAANGKNAVQVDGESATFKDLSMTVSGVRGLQVNVDNTSDALVIDNCDIVFAAGTKRAIQVYNGTGHASVSIVNGSSLTGAGEILVYGYGTSYGDATLTIDDSTVDITGNTESGRHGIELLSNYGDAVLTITDSEVAVTTTNDSDAINVGSQHELDGKGKAQVNITGSTVELDGNRCGMTVFTWDTGNTLPTVVNIADSVVDITGGTYYGLYAYAYAKGDTALTISDESVVSVTAPYDAIYLSADKDYNNNVGNITYTQTDSDVFVESDYYGLEISTVSKSGANTTASATATISGGSFICNGMVSVVSDSADKSEVVMTDDAEVSIDSTCYPYYAIETGKLTIDSGTYDFTYADGTGVAPSSTTGNITGGIFNVDISDWCADTFTGVINTDPTTKDAYPYTVGHAVAQIETPVKYTKLTANITEASDDVYLDMWTYWGMQGMKDADGNECPRYVSITDDTMYRDLAVEAGQTEDWVSAKYLYDNYFAPGKSKNNKQTTYLYNGAAATVRQYETLPGALADVQADEKITLLANVTDGGVLPYAATLDKAGFTCGTLTAPEHYAVVNFSGNTDIYRTFMDNWERPDYADLSWYTADPSASTFEIATAAQFAGFAQLVNGKAFNADGTPCDAPINGAYVFRNKTITLTADIDLSAHGWVPIGNDLYTEVNAGYAENKFRGTLDGANHTITLALSEQNSFSDYDALFGSLLYATIKDIVLNVSASYPGDISAGYWNDDVYGGACGLATSVGTSTVISNVTLNGSFQFGTWGSSGGGLVAVAYAGAKFYDCVNNTSVSIKQYYRDGAGGYFIWGGIAVQTSGAASYPVPNALFVRCVNNATVTMENPYDNDRLIGRSATGYGSMNRLAGLGKTQFYSRKLNAGGIVGQVSASGYLVQAVDCEDNGTIVGGHIEKFDADGHYVSLSQKGSFYGKEYVGGSSTPVDYTIDVTDKNNQVFYMNDNTYWFLNTQEVDLSACTIKGEGAYYRPSSSSGKIVQKVGGAAVEVTDADTIEMLNEGTRLIGPVVSNSRVVFQTTHAPYVARLESTGERYTTFEDAVAAADAEVESGEPDPTITVINYKPETMVAPVNWLFSTDSETGVTMLIRAVAQVVTVDGETVTTNKQFATVQEAIDAAGVNGFGTTVEVMRSVALPDGALAIQKSITLTGAVDAEGRPVCTLTGLAGMTSADYADIYVGDDGAAVAVTISNLKLTGFGNEAAGATDYQSSVVTFEAWEAGSTLTVTNVEFSAYNQYAVATLCDGTLAVQGCAIDGAATGRLTGGVYAENGAAVVSGGTIENVDVGIDAVDAAVAVSGATVTANADGAAVASSDGAAVTVDGGDYAGALDVDGNSDLTVESGHFDRYVDETYCADGKIAVPWTAGPEGWYEVIVGQFVAAVIHDGTTTPYASLESAIAAAASGDTVTLLADIELADRIWMKSGITLDGDGHSIKPDDESAMFNDPRLATDSNYAAGNGLSVINLAADVTDVTIKNVTLDSNAVYPRALIGTGNGSTITLEDVTLNHTSTTIRGADALALNGDCAIKGDFSVALGERSWSAISFNTTNENLDLSDCTSFTVTADDRTGTQPLVFTWNSAGSTVTGADEAGLVSVNGAANLTGFESAAASDKLGSAAAPSTYNFKVGNAYYTTFALAAPVAVDTENAVETFADPEAAYTLAQGSTLKVAKNGHEPTIQTDGGAYVIAEATAGDVTTYSTETAAVSVTDGTDTAYFTTLEEAFGIVEDGDTVTLLANVTLTADAAATPAANANVTLAQGEFSITADGHAIALSGSPLLTVTTDKQTGAFDAAAGYVIVESGSYVYTPTKIVAMIGEKPYTSFEDAVEAVQDGETITVVGYDPAMEAPEGWKFAEDDSTTPSTWTLVQKDYKVTVTDGTTTKQFETIAEAATYVNEQPAGDYTVTIAAGTFDETATFAQDKTKTRNVTVTGTTDDSGNLLTIVIGGQFKIDATAGDMGTAVGSLTFEKIKFDYSGADAARDTPIINSNDQNRYPSNITIDGCEFVGNGAKVFAAIQLKQPYNVVIRDSKFTGGLHSAMQISTCGQGITIDGCEVTDCKNGFSLKTSGKPWNEPITDIVITDTTVSATGYGFRFDANTYERNVTFTGCTVSAEQPIVLRKTTTSTSTVAVTGCTMTPTGTYPWCTVTSGDDGEAAVAPTATLVAITTDLTDAPSIMAGKVGNTYYWPLAKAVEAAEGSPLEVTLVMDANAEALTLPATVSLKLVKNGNAFAGTVTAADGATLNLTETSEYYLWEPTVAEFIYPVAGSANGLPIPSQWLIDNSIDGYTGGALTLAVTNGLVTALTGDGANGMPMWQSYVLGLNPNSATATLRLAAGPVAGDATKVQITGNVTVVAGLDAHTTVTFRLAERNADGTWTDIEAGKASPLFDVSLDDVAGKVLAIFADIVTK